MSVNIDRFNGLAADYDAVRPTLPGAALDQLCEIVDRSSPALVVDLGSGTGLSTRIWVGRAHRIIGVEPNDEMRRQAVRSTARGAVEYVAARSDATGLPDECADIISCVQALHWMDPAATLAEIHRCLRPGGAFAAFDCDWPPFVHWQLVEPWHELHRTAEQIVERDGLAPGLRVWHKSGHLERMRLSGYFRVTFEQCFHVRTEGNAERLLRLAQSQGGLATALRPCSPDVEKAWAAFATRVHSLLGDRILPWTYTFRARVGVK